jgi:tetrahydromethanopterin S-methyltransferase subunit H
MTETEDRIIEVRDVRLGGAPGENPTVLIGSLFYRKSPLILDEYEGKFDKSRAEELLAIQDELSDITGNPAMLDIEGSTSSAVENYIDFVATKISYKLEMNEVKYRLGHRDIGTTQKYVNRSNSMNREYVALATRTEEESLKAIENGYDFIYVENEVKYWRKPK